MSISEKTRERVNASLDKASFPSLVTFERKHGTEQYLAQSKQDMFDICLEIFNTSFDGNYYYEANGFETIEEYINKEAPYTQVGTDSFRLKVEQYLEFKALSENATVSDTNPLKLQAQKLIKNTLRGFHQANEDSEFYKDVLETHEKQDGLGAYVLLRRHEGYEYEKFNVELFDTFKKS